MYTNYYYVYILANKRNGTLYIGVTLDLKKRVYEHKNNIVEGFISKYQVHILVYYEQTQDIQSAIEREKQLKKWNRQWKIRLIEEDNPDWKFINFKLTWIPAFAGMTNNFLNKFYGPKYKYCTKTEGRLEKKFLF